MRITILSMGSRGDVQPCVAIARGLAKQGFRMRIAAPAAYASMITRYGIECIPISHSLRQLYKADPGSTRLREQLEPTRLLFRPRRKVSDVVDRILHELWQACQDSDVIFFTPLTLAGHYMAAALGVRAHLICFQPLARTGEFPNILFPDWMPSMNGLNHASHWIAEQLLWRFFKPSISRWHDLRSPRPLRRLGCFKQFYAQKQAVFNGFSDIIVPRPGDWGSHIHITGYWFLDEDEPSWRPPPALLDFLQRGEPPVGIDFGSMNDNRVLVRARASIQALLNANRRVILLNSGGGMHAEDLPDSADLLVTGYVPHDWLLPRLSTLIHHGGAGTTAKAVRAGTPSIIMPFFFDQFFWARRLQKLGIGPPPVRSSGQLTAAIAAIDADRPMQRRLADLSRRVDAERGVENMVDAFLRECSG